MAETVRVAGLDGVLERLQALPAAVGAKGGGPARAALAKGARVFRDQAIANAPRDTGLLQESIVARRDSRPGMAGASEAYYVGVRRKARRYANTKRNRGKGRAGKTYFVDGTAFYWLFLEFGTEKMAARPFLRPAFESRKEDALNVIVTEMHAGIDRAVRKLGAR
ncbi:MAG TPA: HK97-gp10 family putative phage morphogenesis protein [Pseudoxanthomonas sp.]